MKKHVIFYSNQLNPAFNIVHISPIDNSAYAEIICE